MNPINPIADGLIFHIDASENPTIESTNESTNEQKFFTTDAKLPILRDGKLYFGYEESELEMKSEEENDNE